MEEIEPTYYYKQIDISGNLQAILTCDMHLESSPSQIEITEEEYNTLLHTMQHDNAESDDEEAFEDVTESEDVESIE